MLQSRAERYELLQIPGDMRRCCCYCCRHCCLGTRSLPAAPWSVVASAWIAEAVRQMHVHKSHGRCPSQEQCLKRGRILWPSSCVAQKLPIRYHASSWVLAAGTEPKASVGRVSEAMGYGS